MTSQQQAVLDFAKMIGTSFPATPTYVSADSWELAKDLIDEEWIETIEAQDIYERADGLADLLYVVFWAINTCGIDIEPIFAEVQRSNMSKLWTWEEVRSNKFDASYMSYTQVISTQKLEDDTKRCLVVKHLDNGKVLKSPSYSPANLKPIIDHQIQHGNIYSPTTSA